MLYAIIILSTLFFGYISYSCIVVAIIGHYSGEGTVSEDHFHFETSDARQICINIDKPIDLMDYIVSNFSPFNGNVLDLTEQNGKLFMFCGL